MKITYFELKRYKLVLDITIDVFFELVEKMGRLSLIDQEF